MDYMMIEEVKGEKQLQKLDLLSGRSWLLTAQSQYGTIAMTTYEDKLLCWKISDQIKKVCWIDRHMVRLWLDEVCCRFSCWSVVWLNNRILALKDTPSVEVKADISLRLCCFKWYYYFDKKKEEFSMFLLLQLTFQSQLDGMLVDEVFKERYEGLKSLKKGDDGLKMKNKKIVIFVWCMYKQQLTFKSQLPAKMDKGNEDCFGKSVGLGCCLVQGLCRLDWTTFRSKLKCGNRLGCLYGLRIMISGDGEWVVPSMGRVLLMGWRVDNLLMKAFEGVMGVVRSWFGLLFQMGY
ncbi:hypothetical protein QVD17_21304 [Tagetes erecta]|uniref:Uncharacterized protein n=1 Tax=Tagetes erecta TaxID=13708 RepID=A0AAD8KMS7_TARER|nr:hypothetical protein QVD17_21304 [Tagetes erecta]